MPAVRAPRGCVSCSEDDALNADDVTAEFRAVAFSKPNRRRKRDRLVDPTGWWLGAASVAHA